MYELGIAHALHKEAIMVFQKNRNGESEKFPFDISHIKIIDYVNDAIGGQKMKNRLAETIDYVLDKAVPQVTTEYQTDNPFDEDTQNMILAQYVLRRNRIEYFTYHYIHNFVDFREQHLVSLKKIQNFRDNRQEQDIRTIQSIAQTYSEFVTGYLISFTMLLLNNTANFIDSGWLVNKFPDELDRMADALNYVKSSEINIDTPSSMVSEILDEFKYRIEKINFCIEALEEERKKVHLPNLNTGNKKESIFL
jgi:hypothetical protein